MKRSFHSSEMTLFLRHSTLANKTVRTAACVTLNNQTLQVKVRPINTTHFHFREQKLNISVAAAGFRSVWSLQLTAAGSGDVKQTAFV